LSSLAFRWMMRALNDVMDGASLGENPSGNDFQG
jgi:hypothetical protein